MRLRPILHSWVFSSFRWLHLSQLFFWFLQKKLTDYIWIRYLKARRILNFLLKSCMYSEDCSDHKYVALINLCKTNVAINLHSEAPTSKRLHTPSQMSTIILLTGFVFVLYMNISTYRYVLSCLALLPNILFLRPIVLLHVVEVHIFSLLYRISLIE